MSSIGPQEPPHLGAFNVFDVDRVRQSRADALDELCADLLRASYQPGDVHLDSGVDQPYFFDKYLIASRPAILRRIGRFMASLVPPTTERIASPTLGAVAFGTALSLETGLPFAIVRTQLGDAPRGRAVEGGLHRGETVVLVEDVVVTGSRALQAVDRLQSQGAEVTAVLSVLDCERDAEARLHPLPYVPLFGYSTLFQRRET